MSSQYIFQYPTTGRWVCDFPGSSDTIVGMSFQYPTTGRWVCDVGRGFNDYAPSSLSVPYHGSLGL